MKVMIIDDEPAVLQALEILIDWSSLGFDQPYKYPNGVLALSEFEALQPDLVITDINMPQMDGLGFIEALRDRGWQCPVVIVSGYDDFDYAKRAIQYRVEDYVLKPIDEDELMAVLERVVEGLKADSVTKEAYEAFSQDSMPYQMLHYIHHHYDENLKLKTMAKEFHMTSAYLGQIIKKATGDLFNDYLLKIRMKAAKEMLKNTDAMIYQVAERCGYRDTDYFIKKFSASEGCSPNTYKKNQRGIMDD